MDEREAQEERQRGWEKREFWIIFILRNREKLYNYPLIYVSINQVRGIIVVQMKRCSWLTYTF